MKVLRYLAYIVAAAVLGFGVLMFAFWDGPSIDRIQALSFNGKTIHIVTIGSDGAFNIKTSDSSSEITTMGRRYVITRQGPDLLLDGKPLDFRNGTELSLLLYKDGRLEVKPGKY